MFTLFCHQKHILNSDLKPFTRHRLPKICESRRVGPATLSIYLAMHGFVFPGNMTGGLVWCGFQKVRVVKECIARFGL